MNRSKCFVFATSGFATALWLAIACVAANGVSPAYTVTDLGVTSSTDDGAKAINAVGQVGVSLGAYDYVWTNGVYSRTSGASGGGALGINDLGHLAGSGNLRGFIYRDGQSTDLGQLEPGASYTFAYGINESDVVVGEGYCPSVNRYHAFVWSNGTIHDLTPSPPSGVESSALAINNAGMMVGEYNTSAARWDAAGNLTLLATPTGYVQSGAGAVNGNGDAVGNSAASDYFNQVATVWSASGTMATTLPFLGSYPVSDASGINDSGEIIGTAGYEGTPYAPVLWQNGMAINLNTLIAANSGWALGTPEAINDLGQIVGAGTLNGNGHAYLLTPVPVPEPATATAVVFGAGLLLIRHRRRLFPIICQRIQVKI